MSDMFPTGKQGTAERVRKLSACGLAAALLLLVFVAEIKAKTKFSPKQIEFFETKVRPLLAKHCYTCHSGKAKSLKGGLRLDGRKLLLKGGDSGPAVVPGKPQESLLVESVQWESLEMPPKEKLSKNQIAVFVKWVEMGAPWPGDDVKPVTATGDHYDWAKWRREHWSFQPVRKPLPPEVKHASRVQNEIDRFVLRKLETAKLSPVPIAEPRVLVRRIYIDLIGLPPTPQQVQEFVSAAANDHQAAVKATIDRLLDSPRYGERWGRHWLDVARYSDGFGGFLDSAAFPQAWRYRDWVVDAFNQDLPFDQFIKMQIAGDLIGDRDDAIATGFFALGPTYRSDGGDPDSVAQAKAETLSDRMDTLGRGMLALTLACAQCHEHKFDPLPQQDYYSLAGVFNNTRIQEAPLVPPDVVKTFNDHQKAIKDLDQKIKEREKLLKNEKREPTVEEKQQRDQWNQELEQLKKSAPAQFNFAHALAESGSADMHVAIRGNLRKPGKLAPRRFLKILARDESKRFTQGSGRVELADVVADAGNPLTARVFVNRVWMHHFGKALVRTPSNFGSLGEKPTHPELLDWLTATFIESGWSIKQLHRTIMLSAAWQSSSRFEEETYNKDGDNRLVWRMNLRRMDVESWRDALLSVTGELDPTLGGQPTEQVDSRRRTLYLKVSRNGDRFATDEFLRLFDFPLMRATIEKRPTSIVPQQFLFLMNSEFMVERAKALTSRLKREAKDDGQRIELAYRLLFGRSPTKQEQAIGLEFVTATPEQQVAKTKPIAKASNADILIEDFEGNSYEKWKPEGEAFGPAPARGTLPGQMSVSDFLGQGLVNSFFKGDGTTGTLTSPPLKIERRYIHFLVGGGKYPGETCINLLVNGKPVRTATGPNVRDGGGSERLDWASWDVSELMGKTVRIQIVDQNSVSWGHINVDHIFQSDEKVNADKIRGQQLADKNKPTLTPWQQYVQVLLSSNEFMYVR